MTECGTYAGYGRHARRGETPCEACRAAQAAYTRHYRQTHGYDKAANRRRNRAVRRAQAELARLYPRDYRRLYLKFQAEEES